jgi:hypothetical protein
VEGLGAHMGTSMKQVNERMTKLEVSMGVMAEEAHK